MIDILLWLIDHLEVFVLIGAAITTAAVLIYHYSR